MDWFERLMVETYAGKHDPNRHALRAPIDITDLANLALRQDTEIANLKKLLAEYRMGLTQDLRNDVLDDGSSKVVP